jgi:arginase
MGCRYVWYVEQHPFKGGAMADRRAFRQRAGKLALVGAPVEAGANVGGSRLGPSALRGIGLSRMLDQLGYDVVDYGDVARQPNACSRDGDAHKVSEAAQWISSLSDAAYELASDGQLPVFLGGDHSLSMGTVDGIARAWAEHGRELFLLWLDAHPDFNTPATSPSGNLHGMSLALLCGEFGFDAIERVRDRNVVDPSNVFLFGIRSIDPGEGELLRRRRVDVVDMRAITQQGVSAPLRRILEAVAKRNGVLHVSLDADFVDPAFVPGVNAPVPGGVTYTEARSVMQMLNKSGLVGSVDVAEINPLLDADGRGTRVIAELVACLFDGRSKDTHDHSRHERQYKHNAA